MISNYFETFILSIVQGISEFIPVSSSAHLILISELSGSESLIHFRNENLDWVSLSNGTHQMDVGQEAKLYMNTDEFLYFDDSNNLVKHV